ncbi:MAG: protein-L-isoaspartate(D-aspartate) O-methyltransferase [Acidobacteria bacterium]|nr:protein-L-isoaspartate(D-aspartate) O-methyltransferase [Acidobacteriota bacterium]
MKPARASAQLRSPIVRNRFLCATAALLLLPWLSGVAESEPDYARLREKMVKEQIVARGVKDERVLQEMREVPRHLFVSENLRAKAYDDQPLSIGEGQTISQPYIVALMTELLGAEPDDVVLEVGTGSGYQAAVLSQLARQVYTIEILPALAEEAAQRLQQLGYENVEVKTGDGYLGWPEHAPFDGILVTAAPPEIPSELLSQLKRGGRMVVPVGKSVRSQNLMLLEKSKTSEDVVGRTVIPVRFVPMIRPAVPEPAER